MDGTHLIELFIPMVTLGVFGFVLFGPFGGVMGAVIGVLLGTVASVSDVDVPDEG